MINFFLVFILHDRVNFFATCLTAIILAATAYATAYIFGASNYPAIQTLSASIIGICGIVILITLFTFIYLERCNLGEGDAILVRVFGIKIIRRHHFITNSFSCIAGTYNEPRQLFLRVDNLLRLEHAELTILLALFKEKVKGYDIELIDLDSFSLAETTEQKIAILAEILSLSIKQNHLYSTKLIEDRRMLYSREMHSLADALHLFKRLYSLETWLELNIKLKPCKNLEASTFEHELIKNNFCYFWASIDKASQGFLLKHHYFDILNALSDVYSLRVWIHYCDLTPISIISNHGSKLSDDTKSNLLLLSVK